MLNITLTAEGVGAASYGATLPPRMVTRHEGGTECHILLLLREIFESEYKVRLADIFNHKTEEWKKDSAKRVWEASKVSK